MEAASTLTGLTVGALASGGDTKTATMAGNIALTATDNNYLKHNEIKDLAKAKSECAAGNNSQACARVKELQSLSAERDAALDV
jgi:hypothetical protein